MISRKKKLSFQNLIDRNSTRIEGWSNRCYHKEERKKGRVEMVLTSVNEAVCANQKVKGDGVSKHGSIQYNYLRQNIFQISIFLIRNWKIEIICMAKHLGGEGHFGKGADLKSGNRH
ncbi:hypothetical protein EPI10_002246 [Gossypium australe]|uniref:Uncharacterized protein n=1 Tax=Gossypium australe TaxID=47621 RepID=A0A5B6VDK1_9ROSI|nr:hypothetical protein EPI10_002246 [Gossypium australe]